MIERIAFLLNTTQTTEAAKTVTENVEKGIDIIARIQDMLWAHGPSILLALVAFFIGMYIARFIRGIADKVMTHAKYDRTVRSFASQLIYYVILGLVILTALTMAGVPTTNFLAALGAFGLAIGLALQNNMSNFASGLLILILKPFKEGDYIAVNGVEGSVRGIQLFNTSIVTKENRVVFIPNSAIMNNNVTNSNYEDTRLIPFVFDIGYNNDHHQAIKVIQDVFHKEKRILNHNNIEIGIKEFGDNSVRIAAYPRVKGKEYMSVYYKMMSDVKDAFDKHGIDIPYPQRVVHMTKETNDN